MPGFINETLNITIEQINDIVNVTSIPEFYIKVNHIIYNGYMWFVILWVFWIILYRSAQQRNDQPLNNAMYSGAVVSVVSLLLRGINIIRLGTIQGLLTDHQMWVFPLITLVLAIIIWSIKE